MLGFLNYPEEGETRNNATETAYLTTACRDPLTTAIDTVAKIVENEGPGNILLFVASREEAREFRSLVRHSDDILPVRPIIVDYETNQEKDWYLDGGKRKVLITWRVSNPPGLSGRVKFVVLTLRTSLNIFLPDRELLVSTLVPLARSQLLAQLSYASPSGKSYILGRLLDVENLPATQPSEIIRSDLTELVYYMKILGIEHISEFNYIVPPTPEGIIHALQNLHSIGLLDDLGRPQYVPEFLRASLPTTFFALLLAAKQHDCVEEMAYGICGELGGLGVEKLSGEERKSYGVREGDLATSANMLGSSVIMYYESTMLSISEERLVVLKKLIKTARTRAKYLIDLFKHIFIGRNNNNNNNNNNTKNEDKMDSKVDSFCKSILSVYFKNAAYLNPDKATYTSFACPRNNALTISQNSVIIYSNNNNPPPYIVYASATTKNNITTIRTITPVQLPWIREVASHYFVTTSPKEIEETRD